MTMNPRHVDTTRVVVVISLGISGPCDSLDLALLGYNLLLQSFHLEFLDHSIVLTLPCWVIIFGGSLEQYVVRRRLQNNEEVEMTISECL
jgi:hypothetical protein